MEENDVPTGPAAAAQGHEVPPDLLLLHEVLEWQAALAERG